MAKETDTQTRLEQAGRKADAESTKWVIRKGYKISDNGTEPNEKISSNYWYPMLFFSAELLGKTLGNHLKLKRLTLIIPPEASHMHPKYIWESWQWRQIQAKWKFELQ